ncbi:MAG: RnfABCDGE type electron transport complex subunit D [Bacillota bacterium]
MSEPKTLFNISASPHVRDSLTVKRIMWEVNLALAPATLFSCWWFGFAAIKTYLICIFACVLTEWIIQKARGVAITVDDGSAFLTGLLLAMNIPPEIPWYMPVVGSIAAIGIAKHTMGGLGHNIFNPALIGRAFLLASWPIAMTTWSEMSSVVDGVTRATPLGILKLHGYDQVVSTFGNTATMYKDLFFGFRNGSMGETSVLLLLLGGLFLIWRGHINWQVPTVMIATVGVVTWIFGGTAGLFSGDWLFHILSGGLFLGAFFMATDMVTIPITVRGQMVFAFGCGLIVALIRLKGGYPEGVCYSILLMNACAPLIDRVIRPKKYGAGGK